MKTVLMKNEDDDVPSKLRAKIEKDIKQELEIFEEEATMLDNLKRILLRKKLKKEKIRILYELMEIKRKIKILDELDEKDKSE